jgi:hypothetical protein
MKLSKLCAPLLISLAASTVLGGCVVAADPLPPPRVAVSVGYSPYYYDGYPVYYDTWGSPIFYVGGTVRYVPRTYAHYDVLRRGYHAQPRYYRSGGYRSRGTHPYARR